MKESRVIKAIEKWSRDAFERQGTEEQHGDIEDFKDVEEYIKANIEAFYLYYDETI